MTQRAQYLHLQHVVFFVLEKDLRNVLSFCSGDKLSVAVDIVNSFLIFTKGKLSLFLFNCKQNSANLDSCKGVRQEWKVSIVVFATYCCGNSGTRLARKNELIVQETLTALQVWNRDQNLCDTVLSSCITVLTGSCKCLDMTYYSGARIGSDNESVGNTSSLFVVHDDECDQTCV